MEVSNPSNNQILRYDSATSRWSNNSDLTVAEQNITEILNGTQIVGKAVNDQNGDQIDTTYLKVATASSTYIPLSSKGQANGVAPLGPDNKILSIHLPGGVDDIKEFADLASFPLVGEASIIYVALDTNKIYRWGGSSYVEISSSLALGTTASTAFPGDRGLATETQSNNIVSGVQGLTDTRITNSATNVNPLIINTISGTTANLQEWQLNGTGNARISSGGTISTRTRIENWSDSNNARFEVLTTGPVISRNIADANHALIVNQANAGSTGDILRLQSAGANVLEVTRTGGLNQNGTRLFHQTAGGTFFGASSGNLTLTNFENTAFGKSALSNLSSGANNVAVGSSSLNNLTSGSSIVAIGRDSGLSLTTATTSVFVGRDAGNNALQLASATNSTAIGYQAFTDASNQMVFGNASVTQFKFDRNSGATALLPIISVGGTSAFTGVATFNNNIALAGADRTITNTSNNALSLGTNNTTRLTILNDGNVGIGTTNPSRRLEVISVFGTEAIKLLRQGNYGSVIRLGRNGVTESATISYPADGVVSFDTSDIERMRITSSGLVGINETTLSAQLQVKSGATTRIPLVVDTLASHTALIQRWLNNNVERASLDSNGTFFSNNGFITSTSLRNVSGGNNATVSVPSTGVVVSRNIADTNPALIVNLANASSNANIQVWQKATSALLAIGNDGALVNASTPNNSKMLFTNTGSVISRNINDGQTVLKVEQISALASGGYLLQLLQASTERFEVDFEGDTYNYNGTYGTISDERVKENIVDARNYTEDLMKLRVVKYSLKDEKSKEPTHLGFIAQEVEQVFPKLITTTKRGDIQDFKQLKTSVLIPMLVKAIQELKLEIEELKKK
jgi:hypothetical protein